MPRRSGPSGWERTLASKSTARGPAKMRARVGPFGLPTATPITLALSLASFGFSGFLGASAGLLSVTRVVFLGLSGMNAAAKYWSAMATQLYGPGRGWPPLIHFLLLRKPPEVGDFRSMSLSCCQSILLARKEAGACWSPRPLGHCG